MLNEKDTDGYTALMLASMSRRVDAGHTSYIITELASRGGEVMPSPLVHSSHKEVVRLLVHKGASIHGTLLY